MRWLAPLALLPVLAACSEQQMCISRATYDLRTVQDFVAESRANLARGYAIVETEEVEIERYLCEERPDGTRRYCERPVIEKVDKRVAIDLDAERAKLASLVQKEAQLTEKAQRDVAACKVEFPE